MEHCVTPLTLSYGYGLEPVQLSQQTGALGRVEGVNKLLGSAGRVEGLHELVQRVRAELTPLRQPPGDRRSARCLVAAGSGRGHPGPGSQREGGPQDFPQAG